MKVSRRQFLKSSGAVTLGFSGLYALLNKSAFPLETKTFQDGFGDLVPDPNRIMDLPEGFSYHVFSRTGDSMDDGLIVPGDHDGMAAFAGTDGRTVLIRNHELSVNELSKSPFGSNNELIGLIDQNLLYDAGSGATPGIGGTTTLIYNTETRQLEKHFLSLVGTIRNCAGGPTPWNSWISCEENVQRAGGNLERDHGYNFEVPVSEEMGLVAPVPLKAMGRFYHEAVAVDPKSGIVFQTEDRDDGLIYRFIPDVPENLAAGGRLQALMVKNMASLDTRNWNAQSVTVGQALDVAWLDLVDVESPGDNLRSQGFAAGAARFARGEGMWYGLDAIFFACTNGGSNRTGQIWRYLPSPVEGTAEEASQPGQLELFIEPNNTSLLEKADNVTVSPWGDLIICEDGSGLQFLVGITPQGGLYKLGKNSLNTSELAGATFSPDGTTLFVNIQRPGMTLAITGPWKNATSVRAGSIPGKTIMNSQLHQNYPNPFNIETRIPFTLGAGAEVTLDIYNLTGQLVQRLNLGFKSRGEHAAVWNGRDSSNKILPSGIYLAQMRAGAFTALRRLLLLK